MTDEETLEIVIRQAVPEDAAAVLKLMQQVAHETDYLVMESSELEITPQMEALSLADMYESDNNIMLLVLDQSVPIGSIRVTASQNPHIKHIGEIGISVLKAYWGYGIGSTLMESMLDWVEQVGVIKRLELTVQARNQRAKHLYDKYGFKFEGTLQSAFFDQTAGYLDVEMMARLFNN